MQLHRLLADKTHRLAKLHFGAGHGQVALGRGGIELQAGVVAHGPGQLQLHLHVGHAVSQRLHAANVHTKLLAAVEVVGEDGQRCVHASDPVRIGAVLSLILI